MNTYGETVIIPFFQRKISELSSLVTVLEANYLVEQQKVKELSDKGSEIAEKHTAYSRDLESQISALKNEISKKTTEIGQLSETNSIITKRIEDLKRVINQQDEKLISAEAKNKSLEEKCFLLESKNKSLEENNNYPVKRRKQKETILDGSTY